MISLCLTVVVLDFSNVFAEVQNTIRKNRDQQEKASSHQQKLTIDEFNTDYIIPAEFPDLPSKIVQWLTARQFVIPQGIPEYMVDDVLPINAIKGRFRNPNQQDWAVYCTNIDSACIILFWEGDTIQPEVLSRDPDSASTYKPDGESISCCFFYISPAGVKLMLRQYELLKSDGALEPPPINHDGISFGILDQAIIYILYKYKGKWLSLAGTD